MDKKDFYKIIEGNNTTDYEKYLNTKELFMCQKSFEKLCNQDELMFQIIHQIEELWMKLINYTLFNINEYIGLHDTYRIITLFKRVHKTQLLMIDQLSVMETMAPKEYQKIRIGLGKGSGVESPGFKGIFKIANLLWESFFLYYLHKDLNNIEKIYNSQYSHNDSYLVAESLIEFDELFQIFLYKHVKLVERSIGIKSKSLKGVSVEILNKGIKRQLFPHLWEIRSKMTNDIELY